MDTLAVMFTLGTLTIPWALFGVISLIHKREAKRLDKKARRETVINLQQYKNWRDR